MNDQPSRPGPDFGPEVTITLKRGQLLSLGTLLKCRVFSDAVGRVAASAASALSPRHALLLVIGCYAARAALLDQCEQQARAARIDLNNQEGA